MSNMLLAVNAENWGWNDTWALVGICFCIVLLIMAFFVIVMTIFGVVAKKGKKQEAKVEAPKPAAEAKVSGKADDADYAAIAVALHLYFGGEHDKESNVLTIKNVSQVYSPWLNN